MNRQERRLAARKARIQNRLIEKNWEEIQAYCGRLDNSTIEQFYVAAGLALYNLFQWDADQISRVWAEMNDIIYSYEDDAAKYEARKQELKDKVGIEISLI